MNWQILQFCVQAVKDEILTVVDCVLLYEMCQDNPTLDEFVRNIISFNVTDKPERVMALRNQIIDPALPLKDFSQIEEDDQGFGQPMAAQSTPPAMQAMPVAVPPVGGPFEMPVARPAASPQAAPAAAPARPTPPSAKKSAGIPGLDWFCYLAIKSGYLTREICLGAMAEVDDMADVLDMAQVLLDHWKSSDYQKIQEFVDLAHEKTDQGELPPFSIFSESH